MAKLVTEVISVTVEQTGNKKLFEEPCMLYFLPSKVQRVFREVILEGEAWDVQIGLKMSVRGRATGGRPAV